MEHLIHQRTIIGITSFFLAFSTLFTWIRLYERFCVQNQRWWDDWTMLVSWITMVVMCVMQFWMVKYGAGLTISEVPTHQFKRFSMLFLAFQPVGRVAILFARVSILLFYFRIFFPIGLNRGPLWLVTHLTVWANCLYTIALILVTTLQCVPSGLPWGATCIDQYAVLIASSTFNIISDIIVLAIPLGSIWPLQMRRQTKWAIWALFAFGSTAPLASGARLIYQAKNADSEEKTIVYPTLAVLATAEQVVAMVGGSIPAAASFFTRQFRAMQLNIGRQSSPTSRIIAPLGWRSRRGHAQLQDRSIEAVEAHGMHDFCYTGSSEVSNLNDAGKPHSLEVGGSGERLKESHNETSRESDYVRD